MKVAVYISSAIIILFLGYSVYQYFSYPRFEALNKDYQIHYDEYMRKHIFRNEMFDELLPPQENFQNLILGDIIHFDRDEHNYYIIQTPNFKKHYDLIRWHLSVEPVSYEASDSIARRTLTESNYYKRVFESDTNYFIIGLDSGFYGPLTKKEYIELKSKSNY